jgi:hypothetical protein
MPTEANFGGSIVLGLVDVIESMRLVVKSQKASRVLPEKPLVACRCPSDHCGKEVLVDAPSTRAVRSRLSGARSVNPRAVTARANLHGEQEHALYQDHRHPGAPQGVRAAGSAQPEQMSTSSAPPPSTLSWEFRRGQRQPE